MDDLSLRFDQITMLLDSLEFFATRSDRNAGLSRTRGFFVCFCDSPAQNAGISRIICDSPHRAHEFQRFYVSHLINTPELEFPGFPCDLQLQELNATSHVQSTHGPTEATDPSKFK